MPQLREYSQPPPTGDPDFDRFMVLLYSLILGFGPDTTGELDGANGVIPNATGSVSNENLATDSVTNEKMADDSVGTDEVQENAITEDELDVDTDAVPEGSTNQYYTNERVDDQVGGSLIQDVPDNALTWNYNDVANSLKGTVAKASAVAAAVASGVVVAGGPAGATYTGTTEALIDELKADVNTLVSNLNSTITQLNLVITNLKTAKLMAT